MAFISSSRPGMWPERLRQAALVAALLVPLGLLHAFVLAEIGIGAVDVLFLAECARRRDFSWMRQGWVVLALLWWGWLLLCSTPLPLAGFGVAGWGKGFVQAFVVIRLLLFTAALQNWVLTTQGAQRAAWWALALCAAWIGLESWQQYLTGRNIFGNPRWADGALTGPFWKPRAGALFSHLLYPALLPPVLALLTRPSRDARLGGLALAVLGVLTSVLIGQRMGVALTGFGLAVAALFVRQLRIIAVAAFAVAALAVALTPIISPPTYAKLVQETAKNLDHFLLSPYGELYTRAAAMTLQSPWHGWGYNGFRVTCPLPRFDGGFPSLGIAPTQLGLGACNLHPHNYYMQALTDAGFPGLLLFVALALSWLRALGTGLWRQPEPLRLGLFIAVLTYLWPIGSTDAFPVLYMLGWLFLLLGFGLALAPGRARHG